MSGASLPGPAVDIEVCLGVGSVQPGGVWDAGVWDFNTWQETDTSLGNWTDVTCYAYDLTLAAGTGADGVVTRWEAATCAFALTGSTWDPAGPYAGLLGPGLPVRIRWRPTGAGSWSTAFLGSVTVDGFDYDPAVAVATIAATDDLAILAANNLPELPAPVGDNETADARIGRLADRATWPADRRDIRAGGIPVAATVAGGVVVEQMQVVADSDLAWLWVDRAGRLAYRPQGKVTTGRALNAVIGCHIDDAPAGVTVVEPVTITGQQPTVTRNAVTIARAQNPAVVNDAPVPVTVTDEPSRSRFLTRTFDRTDLVHHDDSWSKIVADAVIMSSAWPTSAPANVELSSRVDPAASVLLLGVEPGMSIRVVDDTGRPYQCEPAGWHVTVNRREIAGTIELLDVTPWYGSAWDDGQWDIGKWGF